ncbi:MAG: hypothetical protein RLN96_13705, partial [Pseudomonadales bacterium]
VSHFDTLFSVNGDYYSAYFDSYQMEAGGAISDLGNGIIGTSFGLLGAMGAFDGYYCDGPCFYEYAGAVGDATVAFAGPNAEFALGTLGLVSDDLYYDFAVTQNFALQRQPLLTFGGSNPVRSSDAVGLFSTVLDSDMAISGLSTSPIDIASLSEDGFGHARALVAGSFSGGSAVEGTTLDTDVAITEGRLGEYGSIQGDNLAYEAYWGRWLSYDQVSVDGSNVDTVGAIHFAYSDDLISTADMMSLESQEAYLSYSYQGGARSVTDQLGQAGSLDSVYMDINFGTQTIEDFEMNLSTGDGNWSVYASGVAIEAYSATQNFEVTGSIDTCGDACYSAAAGNVNTAILGANADAVLGAYNLSAPDISAEAAGTFLLEQLQLIPQ